MFFPNRECSKLIVEPGEIRILRARGGKLTLAEFQFEPGSGATMHSHPHEQVGYVIEGELEFTVGEQTRRLTAGDSIYIPAGTPHGCSALVRSRMVDAFTPQRDDFLT